MQLTWMLDDSATVFITTSLTEATSSEAELYVWVMLKGKCFCFEHSEHAPTLMVVSVVRKVKAFSIVTASTVVETIVAVPVVAGVA